MPNPFPGMNPYLEKPALWQSVHNRLMMYIEDALNAVLPEPYLANTETRCYIERPTNGVQEIYPIEAEEAYINIFSADDHQRIIACLKLLSPTNKTTQNEGRELYLRKQAQLLKSETHLIEIDLLRAGKHSLAAPEYALRPQYAFDYAVCLHRAGRDNAFEVWLNALRERLPVIRVPLEEGVPDVALDLQEVLDLTYERGNYARKIDYAEEAIPPLTGDDAAWADTLLREIGLR